MVAPAASATTATTRTATAARIVLQNTVSPVASMLSCRLVQRVTARPHSSYPARRFYATMATPYSIQVKPTETGLLHFDQDEQAASTLSKLLQEDLEKHHAFFNPVGFHDHIPHHLLTLYGTGASAQSIQTAYRTNVDYQLPAIKIRPKVLDALRSDWVANSPTYLGYGKHYPEFLRFFQDEIEAKGWKDVVKEHLFSGTASSDDLFARLFSGLVHPLIQLMYGLEWEQPAIIAQGLAQAAIHRATLTPFLTKVEQTAASNSSASPDLPSLLETARNAGKLGRSARWNDSNPLNGVLERAEDEALELVSQIRVQPEELKERTTEMIHTAAYVAAAAAFHKPYVPRMDFFLIHSLTSSPLFLTINNYDWIPQAQKVRLLEWKMRLDILEYLAQGCPPLDPSSIANYVPRDPDPVNSPWTLLPRFYDISDDAHVIKTIRSLLLAEKVSNEYEGKRWVRIKGDQAWLRTHYILLDSIERAEGGGIWVRGAGFAEAWDGKPKL